ncbi:MAG: septum formation initiator family protein [Proteobacteria bacterium]|nr:septum formation initiator family protein [Pseudomonadota bacterium]
MKTLTIFLLVIFILLQGKLFMGNGSIVQVISLKKEVKLQQEKVLKLKERNQTLEAEVQDLKHRLEALEERARTDLGMIRQKESFYQFSANGDA